MDQIQTEYQYQNQGVRRNALIFAVLTLIIHIIACFMFGFFFKLPAQATNGEFYPIFIVFAHGMFVIVGTFHLT